MPARIPFIYKLLDRLDKVDKEAVQGYLLELARENEAYAEALEHLPVGVILVGRPAKIRYINRQAAEWLGIDSYHAQNAENFTALVRDRAFAQILSGKFHAAPQLSPEDVHVLEPQEIDLRVMVHVSGDKKYAVVTLFNITAEKSREREQERLARHESLLKLAAGVAHEIGNPLNSLHIHLGLLRQGVEKLPPGNHRAFLKTLSVLEWETRRLDRIVKNFLRATRKPPLRFRDENLNEVIREAVQFLLPELEKKNVSVSLRPDKRLPAFLMDRERLHEVFINLIKNAMEAMPKGGQIRISVTYKGKAVMVRVRDQGEGIPEDVLPHIFEAYYTTKEEGSGLGLMIVYNAVAEHGGRIEVESKEGKGTIFTVLLPVRQPKLQLPAVFNP